MCYFVGHVHMVVHKDEIILDSHLWSGKTPCMQLSQQLQDINRNSLHMYTRLN